MEYLNQPPQFVGGLGSAAERVAARMASRDWEPGPGGIEVTSAGALRAPAQMDRREFAVGEAVRRLAQSVDAAGMTATALRDRLQPILTPGPEAAGANAQGGSPRQVRSDVASAIESLADRVVGIEQLLAAALARLEI